MGSVYVHDGRPCALRPQVDEYGYGPLVMRRRCRKPLDVGEQLTLPDGTVWPVISRRETFGVFGWSERVLVGRPGRANATPGTRGCASRPAGWLRTDPAHGRQALAHSPDGWRRAG
jgi:hypothetical protein